MRFQSVGFHSVLHYGEVQLDFAGGPGGLHVLYGPNETGKSTLLQVMLDVLFGGRIEGDAMRDLYPSAQPRIGAVLEGSDGRQVRIERRKNRSTLVLGEDTSAGLTEDQLANLLAGYDRDRFNLLFGFDHARLRQGGENLLQSGGHAGVSLFEAGGGIQHLQRVLELLKDRSEQLLDPGFARNSAKKLNRAWRDFKQAEAAIAKSGLRSDTWRDLRRRIETVSALIEDWTTRKLECTREKSKLERVTHFRGVIGRIHALRDELAHMGTGKVFTDEQDQQMRSTLDAYDAALLQQRDLAALLERQSSDAQAIHIDEGLLVNEEEIRALADRREQYTSLRRDEIPKLQQQHADLEREVRRALKALAPTLESEQAESLRIPYLVQERIGQVAERLRESDGLMQTAVERVEELSSMVRKAMEELSGLGEPLAVSELRNVLQQARAEGNLDEALARKRMELTKKRESIANLCQRQTVWLGEPADLASLPIPLGESIHQFQGTFQAATRRVEAATADLAKTNDQLTQMETNLQRLEETGHIPDDTELQASRRQRDEGWALVKRAWLQQDLDEEEALRYTGGIPLADAYADAVVRADQTSDWIRRESARSAAKAELLRQQEVLLALRESATALLSEAQSQLNAWAEDWNRLWEPTGIVPLTPQEMREWVTEVCRPVRDAVTELQDLERDEQNLALKLDSYIRRMENELASIPGALEPRPVDWESWIRRCEDILGVADERDRHRLAATGRLEEAAQQRTVYQRQHEAAMAKHEGLVNEWTRIRVEHPGLPEEPQIAARYLSQVQLLLDQVDQRDRLHADVQHKLELCKAYESQVQALAVALAEAGPADDGYDGWVRHTLRRVNEGGQQRARREEILKAAARTESDLQHLRRQVERLQGEIAERLHHHAAADIDSLRAMIAHSDRYKSTDAKRSELEATVRESVDGIDLERLTAEVTSAGDPETVQLHLETLQREIQAFTEQIETEQRRLWELKREFDTLDGSQSDAAESAQAAEHHLAAVDQHWNQYVRVELARRLLQRAIAQFRQQNEATVLDLASAYFSELTLHRYPILSIEYDDNQPYLVVRTEDGRSARVHQLSDGTRDQLYLSLRLAFVQLHLRTSEPLPVIMDDVLVHFDDERAAATLKVLQQVAQWTQVIYFTHQRSVLTTATRLTHGGHVHCVDLTDIGSGHAALAL